MIFLVNEDSIDMMAGRMAEDVNGGSWDTDYSEAQKAGWRLKAQWALELVMLFQKEGYRCDWGQVPDLAQEERTAPSRLTGPS